MAEKFKLSAKCANCCEWFSIRAWVCYDFAYPVRGRTVCSLLAGCLPVVPHVCLFSLAVPQMQQLNVQIKNGTKYSLHFASSNEQQDKQLTKDNKGKDHWGQRERGSGGCSKCSSNDSVNCLHLHNSSRVWVSGFASALKFKVANWMNNEISPSQPQPQLHVHPSILPSVRRVRLSG